MLEREGKHLLMDLVELLGDTLEAFFWKLLGIHFDRQHEALTVIPNIDLVAGRLLGRRHALCVELGCGQLGQVFQDTRNFLVTGLVEIPDERA